MEIFLGSSKERIKILKEIEDLLKEFGHNLIRWYGSEAFVSGDNTLDRLLKLSDQVEAAVLVFGREDKISSRNLIDSKPRDNIILEYGVFVAKLGRDRVFGCRIGKQKMPTDLNGIYFPKYKKELLRDQLERWQKELNWLNRPCVLIKDRTELYNAAILAAQTKPEVEKVQIYSPFGFSKVDKPKDKWLETLRDLVLVRQVKSVEAVFGLPEDLRELARAANHITYFFSHAPKIYKKGSEILRENINVRGVSLNAPVPRGFGFLIVEGRILLIAYPVRCGRTESQHALMLGSQKGIEDVSGWFIDHVFNIQPRIVLQGKVEESKEGFVLPVTMRELLSEKLKKSVVDKILVSRLLTPEYIHELIPEKFNSHS